MRKSSLAALALLACIGNLPAQVVISQVYGGGGNSGAPYQNDFIELFNAGSTPQSLQGWSVQYASAPVAACDRPRMATRRVTSPVSAVRSGG
jgi:hypothetical protein